MFACHKADQWHVSCSVLSAARVLQHVSCKAKMHRRATRLNSSMCSTPCVLQGRDADVLNSSLCIAARVLQHDSCSTCPAAHVSQSSELTAHIRGCVQAWVAVMAWYVEKRRQAETEVARYAEPPSDALLPDHPPNMRCEHLLPADDLHA